MSAQPQRQQFSPEPAPAQYGARLEAVPLANAVTTVAVIAYVLCAAVSIVAPDLLLAFFQSWLHGLSLEPLRPAGPWFQPGQALAGLITFGAAVWIGTAATARLYNTWVSR